MAAIHSRVIGPDPFGRHLRELLTDAGIDTSGIVLQERQWDTCAYGKPFAGPEEGERLDFGRFNVLSRHSADTLLAGLENATGARQAVLIAAAFFGLGHYFGVPYGIIGVGMASFLGWMMGKAMIETRGFFWAWFIHFLQDVMIFSFMAIGSIRPGG